MSSFKLFIQLSDDLFFSGNDRFINFEVSEATCDWLDQNCASEWQGYWCGNEWEITSVNSDSLDVLKKIKTDRHSTYQKLWAMGIFQVWMTVKLLVCSVRRVCWMVRYPPQFTPTLQRDDDKVMWVKLLSRALSIIKWPTKSLVTLIVNDIWKKLYWLLLSDKSYITWISVIHQRQLITLYVMWTCCDRLS